MSGRLPDSPTQIFDPEKPVKIHFRGGLSPHLKATQWPLHFWPRVSIRFLVPSSIIAAAHPPA